MRRVCILTNFNYSPFLVECLESAISQTTPFDQLIAIDDGSTDSSREVITSFADKTPTVTRVFKDNGGQLSCFNAAVPYIRKDDVVWLIDSDDVFPPDYVESTDEVLQAKDTDCLFVTPVLFSDIRDAPRSSRLNAKEHIYLPMTSAVTRASRSWFGAPTSCLCLRGATFLSLFPYPHERDWRTRADDVIIFGSSIMGAKKLYAPSLGVGYRTHGNNNFFGKGFDAAYWVTRDFHLERLFGWYEERSSLTGIPTLTHVMREIALVPKAYRSQFLVPSLTRLITARLFGSLPSVMKRILMFGL
jgi:glycosyltransferase involved in cell wall biosynthesis